MKSNEEIVKAINNRIDRIIKYQDKLEELIQIEEIFTEQFFTQESIKMELISLLEYIEEK